MNKVSRKAEKLFPGKDHQLIDDLSEFDISALGNLKFWEPRYDGTQKSGS